jgi:alpha/beta superfamily hydrolase
MVEPQQVGCRSTDGLELEAVTTGPHDAKRALVFCHPHPQMGGTMNAPLLLAIEERLVSEGWGVLRFNFRGIGGSEGRSSDGIAEIADAEGAVAAARDRWPSALLALGGWSFGGSVAIRVAARDESVAACAAIAPAVTAKASITAGVPPAAEIQFHSPLLVICGANDKQVSTEEVRAWAEAVGAEYVEVAGANHFFWAKYDQLADILGGWLGRVVTSD